VCCSVLQRVAVCCRVCCSVLQLMNEIHILHEKGGVVTFLGNALWYEVVQCVAVCCSVLQRVAVCCKLCCSVLQLTNEIHILHEKGGVVCFLGNRL